MADIVSHRSPYLAGSFVDGEGTPFDVSDPSTGEAFATVQGASVAQYEQAIAAARHAFDEGPWPRLSMEERVEVMRGFAEALERQRDILIETMIAEAGCPRPMTEMAQLGIAMDTARSIPGLALRLPEWEHNELPLERYLIRSNVRLSIRRYEAAGVVAAIVPYNFPLICSLRKVIPALTVGCPVILRPSPLTPLTELLLGTAADEAGLPPGVLSVMVDEGAEGGQCLSSHRDVDVVSFTGSVAVGRSIAAQAAPTLKRLILELGGKSVQLHLPDVLESSFANVIASGRSIFMSHAGQGCSLQTRMLVPENRKAEVLDALAAAADELVVGDAHESTTQVGPVISQRHRDGIHALVTAGLEAGGRLVAGGGVPESPSSGWYYRPTVVDVEDNANPLAQREVFGPVLTVQGYRDLDEAVAIANDSDYGLAGGVYTADLQAGLGVAERIRTGTVSVNIGGPGPFAAISGYKQSGIGHEDGALGIRAYQESKHISVGSR